MRRLYNWTMQFAAGPNALLALIVISFAEASVFPLPPELLLIPMVLARPDHAIRLAGWCTLASVAGGMLGYWIGASLYDTVGLWIIHLYGLENRVESLRQFYQQWGAIAILLKGVSPIPYKLVAIISGFSGYNFVTFIVLSFITRGLRFAVEAWLLARYGEPARHFIEKRLEVLLAASAAVIVLGFVVVMYLL